MKMSDPCSQWFLNFFVQYSLWDFLGFPTKQDQVTRSMWKLVE